MGKAWSRNLIVWMAAIAVVLAAAVASRPQSRVAETMPLVATSTRQVASPTLEPKEMPSGCLSCPISSYLASPRAVP